eukprot:gb/GECG01006952.1/.p1 GENE.gb/GECG01006952.1/~~gb/GECG01006952.1/.p1  ORF type:complete len:315 (+),score=32.18 gb/GECG01006952.1/:1-945(+)
MGNSQSTRDGSATAANAQNQQTGAFRYSFDTFRETAISIFRTQEDPNWTMRAKVGGVIGWGGGTLLGGLRGIAEHRRLLQLSAQDPQHCPRPSTSEVFRILSRSTFMHGLAHSVVGACIGYAMPLVLPLSMVGGDIFVTSLIVDRAHASGLTLDMEKRLDEQIGSLRDITDPFQTAEVVKRDEKDPQKGFLRRLEAQLLERNYRITEWTGGMITSTATVLATRRMMAKVFYAGTDVKSVGLEACWRSVRVPVVGSAFATLAAFTFGVGRAIFPALMSLNSSEHQRVEEFRKKHGGHSFKVSRKEGKQDDNTKES